MAHPTSLLRRLDETWGDGKRGHAGGARTRSTVRVYLAISIFGNVILFGYAHDWIRTLAKRTGHIHLKGSKCRGYQWANILEGDGNWPHVRRAPPKQTTAAA